MLFHDFAWINTLLKQHELLAKLLDLVLILSKECILGIFVDARLVLDVFGSGCITKGVHSFVIVVVCWANI
jgi:hypothetical protein